MDCPYCGNDCSPRAAFCPKCGEVFDTETKEPAEPQMYPDRIHFNQNGDSEGTPPQAAAPEEVESAPKSEREFLNKEPVRKGLVNVVVDETTISSTDGFLGELYYRGYSIFDLVEHSCFEEVTFLLINGRLPTAIELDMFKERLVAERDIPDRVLMILKSFPRNTTRIELTRTAISALSLYDEDDYEYSEMANIRKGIRIIAKLPTILAFSHRIKGNQPIIEPTEHLSHGANFYYMLTGKEPSPEIDHAMDVLLMCHAEHSLNASTFAARVTVSTLSDIYSAVTSAIGTLRGPLHGGANERVFNYLTTEIKRLDNVIPWVEGKLARKEKVMGFGHRVYKVIDPRARVIKELARKFWKERGNVHQAHDNLFEMCEKLEEYMCEKKGLYPNVDFYSAIVLHALEIPGPLYTPFFAAARSAGWVSHAIEQLEDNKLIRPRMRYVGDLKRPYPLMSERN